ncbi:MAG: hypothetical protein EXR79_09325 [Myxococcales bacterium]|nr:hypothetical protein [Myxococcales bacterium]
MKRAVALALATWATATAARAEASVFDMFGASPRAVALAGTGAAAARGGEAAFHNPALLAASPVAGAWGGATWTRSALSIQLQRPVCEDRWQKCHALHPAGFSTRAPQLPRDSSGFAFGWHYPVGGVFRDRITLGAQLALPHANLLRISGPDPQSPNFLLYEGMPDRFALLIGGAVRVTDWWWVGIGTQVLAVLDARIDLSLDPTNHDTEKAAIAIGLRPRASLTAGTALHPMPGLWLGIGWRQRVSLAYQIPTAIDTGQAFDVALALGHETLFTPDTLQTGFAWRSPAGAWLVAADLALQLWSGHPDPSLQVALDVGGPAVRALGADHLLDVGRETAPIRLGFRDTWSPAVAVEWRPIEGVTLRTGYRVRPSPAPYATGPTSYLDNDVHAIGAGVGWGFGTPLRSMPARLARRAVDPGEAPWPLQIDLGVQGLWLPRRTVWKDDAHDPVGPLSHGGFVWHVAAAFGGAF